MRITTKELNKIIKEEVRNVLKEQASPTVLEIGGGSDPAALERYLVRGEVALPDNTIVSVHRCPGHRSGPNQFNGILFPLAGLSLGVGDLLSTINGGNVRLTFPNGISDETLARIQQIINQQAPRILRSPPSIRVISRGAPNTVMGAISGAAQGAAQGIGRVFGL